MVDGHRAGRLDAQADAVALDLEDVHHDVVADEDALVGTAGRDEHVASSGSAQRCAGAARGVVDQDLPAQAGPGVEHQRPEQVRRRRAHRR